MADDKRRGSPPNPWDVHADAFAAWTATRYGTNPEDTSTVVVALLDVLGDVAGQAVLDAACGEGLFSRVLAGHGARVTGLDISQHLIQIARERDRTGRIDFGVADLALPQPALVERFDLVACHLALNDVVDNRAFARTLAAAVRPGGRLALAFNNPYSSVVRGHVTNYFESGAAAVYGGMSERLGGAVGYHHRTLEHYVDAFLSTGVRLSRLVDVAQDGPFPFFMVLAFDKPR